MRRREFIAVCAAAAIRSLLSVVARVTEQARRIGTLMLVQRNAEARSQLAAFRQTPEQHGWTDGRNIHIEERWAGADTTLTNRTSTTNTDIAAK
jgi:putative tryptophan/tyrosine transport system substrate-binding protein